MPVVSVRLEEKDMDWLRRHRHRPGAFARLAVHEAIRREEIRETRRFLDANRVTFDRPTEDILREDRDSH